MGSCIERLSLPGEYLSITVNLIVFFYHDSPTRKQFPRVDTTLAQLCEFGKAVLYNNGWA